MVKKIFKILLILAGTLTALLILIVFLLGMGVLNGTIKKTISAQAAKSLNGQLSIGSMQGRLFTGFTLHDMILVSSSDTIIKCDEIDIRYNLKALLHKKIEMDLIWISNPSFNLKQEQDSSWNFMNVLKSNDEMKDTVQTTSTWSIIVKDLRVSDLTAGISPLSKGSIPEFVHAEILLNASAYGDTFNVGLDTFQLITRNPDFKLLNLSGQFLSGAGTLRWKDVRLKLENSLAQSDGIYNTELSSSPGIKLMLSPLSIDDIRQFLPDTAIYGAPYIKVFLSGDPRKYIFNLQLSAENQKIDFEGELNDYKSDAKYSGSLKTENLDPSYWTHDKSMSSKISGRLDINGSGFDIKNNNVTMSGNFGDLTYASYKVSGFNVDATKTKDRAAGSLSAGTAIGQVKMKFDLRDIFSIPAYDLLCNYNHVNAAVFPGLDSLQTNLNGQLHIKGRGVSPAKIKASAVLNSYNSRLLGDSISNFTFTANYDNGTYNFYLPDVVTPYFRAGAEGKGNIGNYNETTFHIEPLEPARLLTAFGMPQINVSGKAEGTISDQADSLKANLMLDLSDIKYDSLSIGQLTANANVTGFRNAYKGFINVNSANIVYGSSRIKSADLNAEGSDSTIHADIRLNVDDSLRAAFTGLIAGFKNPMINIEKLAIDYGAMSWASINDSASVELTPDYVLIDRFGMSSGDQEISVNGRFAFRGSEDISLRVDNLDLALLPLEKFLPVGASGLVSSYFHLGGTSSKPVIEGNLSADKLGIGDITVDSIRSSIQYNDEMLAYDGRISQELNDSIAVVARIPVHISFSDSIYLKRDSQGFELKAGFDSLDLKSASSLFPLPGIELNGIAGFSADIKNTMNDPDIGGHIKISNGRLRYPDFGIDYKDILISAGMQQNRIAIDKFSANAGKGNLDLQGSVGIQSIDSMNLKDINLALDAKNFQALKSGKAELNFNSDAKISSESGKSNIGGTFRINSSKINVDYLTSEFSKKKDEPDPPLLVAALMDTNSVAAIPDTSKASSFSYAELLRNMGGEMTIDIPGNTWVTGEDMNFELEGTMRVVIAKSIMNLFGDLNVKRGYYKIYGRSFNFNKGKITFTGGSEINPEVDFEIIYRFRDIDKDLRNLKLTIQGRMLQPELAFFLDDEVLEEKDALSYIAFGKSVNQLGEGERSKMSGQSIAMGTAVTQLSSALKGVLQESAGIDVFEVTEGEDWKSGNVTIGKYVTNKLFLGYERSFDFSRETKTANTEKVMLEYQILRNLILKATNQAINSGFDLIFRKSWR
jgi:hypothetical protein